MFKRPKLQKCIYEFENVCIVSDSDLENLGSIDSDCYIDFKIRNGDCLRYRFNRYKKIARLDHIDGKSCPKITGTKILKAVDHISKELGVRYVQVNDASNIDGIPLAWLSLFRDNKTWYEKYGYIPENYGEYEFRKNRLLNTVLQHGKTLRETVNSNDSNEFSKFLTYMKNNEDFKYINNSLKTFRKYYIFEDEMDICDDGCVGDDES